jgi:hypothetical protein
VISKKFQPHFSVQHSTLDTLNTNKNHDNNKQNNFPHNIGITDNPDTDKPQNQKDQVWDKHDHNHNLQIYGSAVNDIINTATITPINKTPKIIINTYTKNLTTNPEPTVQYHTPNIRTGNDTPITDFFHITHNETNTPILKPQNSVEAIQLTENIYLNTPTITNPIPIPLHHPNKNTLHNNVNQSGSSKIFNDNTNTNEYFLSQKNRLPIVPTGLLTSLQNWNLLNQSSCCNTLPWKITSKNLAIPALNSQQSLNRRKKVPPN